MAAAVHRAEQCGRPGLTAQERRALIAWLHTDNKETVAKRLHIAPSTVRTHLQRIRQRYATVGRPARAKSLCSPAQCKTALSVSTSSDAAPQPRCTVPRAAAHGDCRRAMAS